MQGYSLFFSDHTYMHASLSKPAGAAPSQRNQKWFLYSKLDNILGSVWDQAINIEQRELGTKP